MGQQGSEHVQVDDRFVRVGAKSYAVNKITSVEIRSDPPRGKSGAILLGAITLFLLYAAYRLDSFGFVVAAIVTGVLAWREYQRWGAQTHRLFLMLASQEAAAFASRNEWEVENLRDEIERVVAASGR